MRKTLSLRPFSAGFTVQNTQGQICTATFRTTHSHNIKGRRHASILQRRNFGKTSSRAQEITNPNVKPLRTPKDVKLDHVKIPVEPTWSVRELLGSYPYPKIDDETLDKLHRLSALTPPPSTTTANNSGEKDERSDLKAHLEGLVKLVNAVRLADVSDATGKLQSEVERETGVPDGRIYPIPQKVDLGSKQTKLEAMANQSQGGTDSGRSEIPSVDAVEHPKGRDLLRHSQTSKEGMDYVLPNLIKRR
jgi:hypothetical protein